MYSWDITKLHGPAKWTYYHLYVILDIYSRYVVLCRMEHGVPGGEDTKPKIRVDRRYGPRIPRRQADTAEQGR